MNGNTTSEGAAGDHVDAGQAREDPEPESTIAEKHVPEIGDMETEQLDVSAGESSHPQKAEPATEEVYALDTSRTSTKLRGSDAEYHQGPLSWDEARAAL